MNEHPVPNVQNRFWRIGPIILQPSLAPLFTYSLIMFLIYLGDGLMAYVAPIYIEDTVHNPLFMGLVMAFSSIVGITCDTLFPTLFRTKHHLFFLWSTIIIALLFPLAYLLLPPHILTLLIGMAIWGIYFEFLVFSNYHFVHAFTHHDQHPFAWGMITTFRSIGLLFSPIIASFLFDIHPQSPLLGALVFFGFALCAILTFKWLFPQHHHAAVQVEVKKGYRFFAELKVWNTLLKAMWPVYFFTFALFVLESAFFTIGVLLSEELHATHAQSVVGNFLISAYVLPALFMGALAGKAAKPFGQKRMAFFCGIVAGIVLMMAGIVNTPLILVCLIFLSAIFSALAMPLIMGATQDYVGRLGQHKNEIIGLENSAGSLAYIIGPIICGGIAAVVGNQRTFSVIGGILFLLSLIALVIVPRKIHMPQRELQELDTDC